MRIINKCFLRVFSPIHGINCHLLFRVWYDVRSSVIFHTV